MDTYVCVLFETNEQLKKTWGAYAPQYWDNCPVAFYDCKNDFERYETADEFLKAQNADKKVNDIESLYYELDNSNDYTTIINSIRRY